jgi:hypothetical protein
MVFRSVIFVAPARHASRVTIERDDSNGNGMRSRLTLLHPSLLLSSGHF